MGNMESKNCGYLGLCVFLRLFSEWYSVIGSVLLCANSRIEQEVTIGKNRTATSTQISNFLISLIPPLLCFEEVVNVWQFCTIDLLNFMVLHLGFGFWVLGLGLNFTFYSRVPSPFFLM